MLAASFAFAFMGLLVKAVSAEVPTGEVVFWRNAVTTVVLAVVAGATGTSLRPTNVPMLIVRALVGLASMGCYFYGISRLPLGDAVLLTYLSPVLVAAWSARVGERVARPVWGALALGFLGVALVARPTGTPDWPGLAAALVAAGFAASAYLSVRVLTRTDSAASIVFWFSAIGAAVSSASGLDGLVVPSGRVGATLLAMGFVGAAAQSLMTRAYALAPAAEVSVYSYATPVFAYALGALWLREIPPLSTVLGTAMVVASGALAARAAPGGPLPAAAGAPPRPG